LTDSFSISPIYLLSNSYTQYIITMLLTMVTIIRQY